MKCILAFYWLYDRFYFWSTSMGPSLSDLPNHKETPYSHTRSPAQWKPSDTLHYVTLVPIKGDTTPCQRAVIASGKGKLLRRQQPPAAFQRFGVCLLRRYKAIRTDGKGSIGCRCEGASAQDDACLKFFVPLLRKLWGKKQKRQWRNQQTKRQK